MERQNPTLTACALCMLFVMGTALATAATTERGPSGCPPSVDASRFVCYTVAEERLNQQRELGLEQQKLDLKLALADMTFKYQKHEALSIKRWGWSIGPGAGLGVDGEANAGLYVTFGWRVR